MKPTTSHKIKDLVEPQTFDASQNYTSDLRHALATYRFTDPTSDLLARWLDALADLQRGRGAARALAGLRGVGKSHLLAAFGALVEYPEARSTVADSHVATSARRLMNRPYLVVHVERGTRQTLSEEIIEALRRATGDSSSSSSAALSSPLTVQPPEEWDGDLTTLLAATTATHLAERTLVLIVDSAYGRDTRINRNDGALLSALAGAAETANAFIALALDDDIADASGANIGINKNFQIDYLDPEHLHRVADQYVLKKNREARVVLHDIYTALRQSTPGFNWSEPRFTALYPVHPLVADVAAAVRLYAPNFAFLPFAAAAAQRAVGRPALSLVLLDEVFDRAEVDLRRSEDLTDAFAAYDRLVTITIPQLPVMQRLEAKLLLKGLFVLSLDGRGATASELCAAFLFQDARAATAAAVVAAPNEDVQRIEAMLRRFVQVEAEKDVQANRENDGEARYRFRISLLTGFDHALTTSTEQLTLDSAAISEVLVTAAHSRFEDWPLVDDSSGGGDGLPRMLISADVYLTWRGSNRHGRLTQQSLGNAHSVDPPLSAETANHLPDTAVASPPPQFSRYDWEITVLAPDAVARRATAHGDDEQPHQAKNETSSSSSSSGGDDAQASKSEASLNASLLIFWQPAKLTSEEQDVLRRLLALRRDTTLSVEFGDAARAAEAVLAAQAERIWTRLYVDEGCLLINDTPQKFTPEARASVTFVGAIEATLASVFEARYPQHPVFAESLGAGEVANLVDGFGGATIVANANLQRLIDIFAVPLGLAVKRDEGVYTFDAGDKLLQQRWIREVLMLTEAAQGAVVSLAPVRARLGGRPFGLTDEAQHLVLAALVAQRRLELVTTAGTSVGRRLLNRSFDWNDVVGIKRAATIQHNAETLTAWARLVTDQPTLPSIDDLRSREQVRAALAEWLARWHTERLLERAEELPDRGLVTHTATLVQSVRRTFGAVAEAIQATLDEHIPLEEALQRTVDVYADSSEAFESSVQHLSVLLQFVEKIDEREDVRRYLAFAETTVVNEIESARRELTTLAEDVHTLFDRDKQQRFESLWAEFHRRYVEHYAAAHDQTVSEAKDGKSEVEGFVCGEEWREFEALAGISVLDKGLWNEAQALIARTSNARCSLPVRQLLIERPSCACSFRLARAGRVSQSSQDILELVRRGRDSFRRVLLLLSRQLADGLRNLTGSSELLDEATAVRAGVLAEAFRAKTLPEYLSAADAKLIERALAETLTAAPVRVRFPATDYGLQTRDELQARLEQWLAELPSPSLLEVTNETE